MPAVLSIYLPTVLVFFGVSTLGAWSLNVQYGVAGIYNFAWVVFQACGAYAVGVLTLGPSSGNGGFQHYILGFNLPFPIALLGAAVASGLLALCIGLVALRGLARDVEAILLLVVSVVATLLVNDAAPLFNGPPGLALIPQPFRNVLPLTASGYSWGYVLLTWVIITGCYFAVVRPMTTSPVGRVLRAIRDNPTAIEALGRNVFRYRLWTFTIGGALAGVSGGLLAAYLTTWDPSAWLYVETFVVFTAIIVGGRGSNIGALVGAALVPTLFLEVTRFIPTFGYEFIVSALQWVVIGGLSLVFLWLRPQGVIPERRPRLAADFDAARERRTASGGALAGHNRGASRLLGPRPQRGQARSEQLNFVAPLEDEQHG